MKKKLFEYFTKPGHKLRAVAEADIDLLVRIINEAYSYQDQVKGSPRTNPDHLRKRIAETDFYVIEAHGEVVGCVYLEPRGASLHFGLLTLRPEARKTGVAQAVMTAIVGYAQASKYAYIDLDYMSLAPWLKSYYERYDFLETGEVALWGSIELVRMRRVL